MLIYIFDIIIIIFVLKEVSTFETHEQSRSGLLSIFGKFMAVNSLTI
jgi:hypothetical protein